VGFIYIHILSSTGGAGKEAGAEAGPEAGAVVKRMTGPGNVRQLCELPVRLFVHSFCFGFSCLK